jgi:subtilase family serine protease
MTSKLMKAKTALCVFALLISLSAALPLVTVSAKGFEPLLVCGPITDPDGASDPAGFTPQQIWTAYDFQPLLNAGYNGAGQTIAIVDAYGSKSIQTDVATFSSQFGLPSLTLNIYYPDGTPRKNTGWAQETSLDVEWAHAIAPNAKIALVVAYSASFQYLYNAINYTINSVPGVTVISMSFGALESSYSTTGSYTISAFSALFAKAVSKGISCFASSGDNGANGLSSSTLYPASDPNVTAVGGTSLYLNSDNSYKSETTWNGTGAGASTVFSKPSWQDAHGNNMRDIVDVAYDSDPYTGFPVCYTSLFRPKWYEFGGTSDAAPQWAALFAIAVQYKGHTFGNANAKLYSLSSSVYHDITTGNDGYFSAGKGWDYPTGLGTPDANLLVKALP